MSVLDLATGRGEPAIRVAQFLGANGKVVGVDSSEAMLRMAQERAIAKAFPIYFYIIAMQRIFRG